MSETPPLSLSEDRKTNEAPFKERPICKTSLTIPTRKSAVHCGSRHIGGVF